MPGNKHLHGVSAREQREYEPITESAQRSGHERVARSAAVAGA
jgi:hypothetical protein